MEFHYEVSSPFQFQCKASFWLANFLVALDVSQMILAFKEPAGTVSYSFEAFSTGCIILKLQMISFFPIIFQTFLQSSGILLIFYECSHSFYYLFLNLGIRRNGISQVIIINQKILFDQCSEQLRPLFQFISVVFSQHSLQYFLVMSLYCWENLCIYIYIA